MATGSVTIPTWQRARLLFQYGVGLARALSFEPTNYEQCVHLVHLSERVSDTFAYGSARKKLVSTLRVFTSLKRGKKAQCVSHRCKDLFERKKYFGVKCTVSGLLPGGGTWRKKTIFTQQISLRKHCTECNGTIGQITTPGPIYSFPGSLILPPRASEERPMRLIPARPKPDSIDETKSGKLHLQAATVSVCYFFPRKKCGR